MPFITHRGVMRQTCVVAMAMVCSPFPAAALAGGSPGHLIRRQGKPKPHDHSPGSDHKVMDVEMTHAGSFYADPKSAHTDSGTLLETEQGTAQPDALSMERQMDTEGGTAKVGAGEASFGAALRSLPLRRVASSRDIYTTLDVGKTAGTTVKKEEATKLEEVCVANCVGGFKLATDESFQVQTKRGHAAAASKGVVFAGLARNIGHSVPVLMFQLRRAGRAFARYHIILLENDSGKDGTRVGFEEECSSHTDVWCFELNMPQMGGPLVAGNPQRVAHFTYLRQSLLEQVRHLVSVTSGSTWDFLVLFDGDMFADDSAGFHPSMIDALLGFPATHTETDEDDNIVPVHAKDNQVSALEVGTGTLLADRPWDVVCANQLSQWPHRGRYRDTFALKRKSWQEAQASTKDESLYFVGNKLIPVKSCFSGLALYSMNAVLNSGCNYTYEDETTCEHVPFHKCLAHHGYGKVAIYPPLTNRVWDGGVVEQTCVPATP